MASLALVAGCICAAFYADWINRNRAAPPASSQEPLFETETPPALMPDVPAIALPRYDAGAATATIDEIFGGESLLSADADETDAPAQSAMDRVKRQYEQSLVMYFFLRRCGAARQEDYHLLASALLETLAAEQLSAAPLRAIVQAAKGSYDELYSATPCDDARIPALSGQFRQFLDAILARAP